jgi:hypothetical protein
MRWFGTTQARVPGYVSRMREVYGDAAEQILIEGPRRYQVTDVTPGVRRPRRSGLEEVRMTGLQVTGAALAEIGLAIAAQRTLTAVVILVEAL